MRARRPRSQYLLAWFPQLPGLISSHHHHDGGGNLYKLVTMFIFFFSFG